LLTVLIGGEGDCAQEVLDTQRRVEANHEVLYMTPRLFGDECVAQHARSHLADPQPGGD